jgi:holin-like protein
MQCGDLDEEGFLFQFTLTRLVHFFAPENACSARRRPKAAARTLVQYKVMVDYLRGTLLLVALLLLGQGLHALGCPLPGSVAGLLLLLLALTFGLIKLPWVEHAAGLFLRHMVLLFVPVTVGLVDVLPLLKRSGVAIMASLLVSLLATLAATALLARWLLPYDANSVIDTDPELRREEEEYE